MTKVGYDTLATGGAGTNATSAVQAQLAEGLQNSGGVGKAILANSGGVAANPHRVVLFEGVGFRDHSFSYQFTPKSYSEAETLRQIIRAFKYHSAPGFASSVSVKTSNLNAGIGDLNNKTPGKFFFKYPEFFTIEFHHKDHLFEIAPSVLTRFSVDYHPLNTPAYAREEGGPPTPVQINISMSFQETEIVTKEAVDKGR
ncbi:MAG: hypothetical protein EBU08_14835 [Micrococcales bacterium]|nr:hypothetical protein [Micrococcales bacterium]